MDILIDFFSYPFDLWRDGSRILAVVVGLLMIGALYVAIRLIIAGAKAVHRKIYWLTHREQCQHCQQYTLARGDSTYVACHADQACCRDCYIKHVASAEPVYNCPVDGQLMLKPIENGLIIDRCPGCGSVFLSATELGAIVRRAEERGVSRGESDGFMYGLMLGTVID